MDSQVPQEVVTCSEPDPATWVPSFLHLCGSPELHNRLGRSLLPTYLLWEMGREQEKTWGRKGQQVGAQWEAQRPPWTANSPQLLCSGQSSGAPGLLILGQVPIVGRGIPRSKTLTLSSPLSSAFDKALGAAEPCLHDFPPRWQSMPTPAHLASQSRRAGTHWEVS